LGKTKNQILRFIAFSTSTLAGTAVDTLVLWLCAHLWLSGTYWGENLVSPAISFECAAFTNFILAYFGVWSDRITTRGKRSFLRHFLGYNAACIGGFLVKMAFLQFFVWLFHGKVDVVICNLIALCFSGCFNYAINELVVFRKKKEKVTDAPDEELPDEEQTPQA